jgi:CheY-like chemotaxis protein
MRQIATPHFEKPPQILLVDDNHQGLIARKSVLHELGYSVVTATGGEEALELLGRQRFDVIVTDYKMPRMDGVELIRRIRSVELNARIILLSGFVEPLGLCEQTTGADVVVAKSAGEVGNLIRSLRRLLSKTPARKPPASAVGSMPAAAKSKGL